MALARSRLCRAGLPAHPREPLHFLQRKRVSHERVTVHWNYYHLRADWEPVAAVTFADWNPVAGKELAGIQPLQGNLRLEPSRWTHCVFQ